VDDVIYLALLRGVNVGGKNKVEMSRLRDTFEALGLTKVRTYINSGNVIFGDDRTQTTRLISRLEESIAAEFGFPVRFLVRDLETMKATAEAIPSSWKDDSTMRCYVMFLWNDVDDPAIVERLTIKDAIDDVVYVPGAIVWRVDRADLTRSGMMKLTSDALYQSMTIRNSNTVRRLVELMTEANNG
jgi:uncharacterized protein (DUF1697 family)